MHDRERENPAEFYHEIKTAPPAIELLSNPARAAEFWPEQVANDPEFIEQLESRQTLNERLDAVVSRLPRPDVSLDNAITEKLITPEQARDLYDSFSALLESSPDYRRIVLYLPFEFLPDMNEQQATEELERSAERFKTAYMSAWRGLLGTLDVRANFVDGNVLDFESRTTDLPRVVKAAHLIPKLAEKGFMAAGGALDLIENSNDETLRRSISETLPVLADMKLISDADLERIRTSGDQFVLDKYIVISNPPSPDKQPTGGMATQAIQEGLRSEFARIDTDDYGDVTKKRKTWLRQDARRKAVLAASEMIAASIEHAAPSDQQLEQYLAPKTAPETQQALIEGVRNAIENVAHADASAAQEMYAKYHATFLALWDKDVPALRESLAKTFYRLHKLQVVDDGFLRSFDLRVPKLAGPFSENLHDADLSDAKDLVALIEQDPELSRAIHPAALVFGSRLKGYGVKNADIDIAVIIKSGTDPAEAETIRERLSATKAHANTHGEIVEFWTEKTADGLEVRDGGIKGSYIGGPSWTHVLFGAAWEGEAGAIKELREKLLVPYFYEDKNKVIDGRAARGLYLEELERDNLQYRLMHKGWERFNPEFGGLHTPHADEIDGKSAFWDSGYRQAATKLFASRVFLPKLER